MNWTLHATPSGDIHIQMTDDDLAVGTILLSVQEAHRLADELVALSTANS